MLVAQGKIIYFNEAQKSSDYFAAIGYECPAMSNPADYFMTIMSPENPNDDLDEDEDDNGKPLKSDADILKDYTKKVNYFCDMYNKSELKNQYAFISKEVVPIHTNEIQNTSASWCQQLGLLTKRSFNNIIRLP